MNENTEQRLVCGADERGGEMNFSHEQKAIKWAEKYLSYYQGEHPDNIEEITALLKMSRKYINQHLPRVMEDIPPYLVKAAQHYLQKDNFDDTASGFNAYVAFRNLIEFIVKGE